MEAGTGNTVAVIGLGLIGRPLPVIGRVTRFYLAVVSSTAQQPSR